MEEIEDMVAAGSSEKDGRDPPDHEYPEQRLPN
jgi:hypothetical protein